MAGRTSVLIATVGSRAPDPPYWMGILGLDKQGIATQYEYLETKAGVDGSHNFLIKGFLQSDLEWMLHLDSDALVHADTLKRLLSYQRPFVSALAFQRRPPYMPVVYNQVDENGGFESWYRPIEMVAKWLMKHGQAFDHPNRAFVLDERKLFPVKRGGAHCLLTHRSVFEAIEPPWFQRYGQRAAFGSGSDFWFYKQAIEQAGVQPYVALDVISGHLEGGYGFGPLDFMTWYGATRRTEDGEIQLRVPTLGGSDNGSGD